MNIIIPLCGRGSRFQGIYDEIKPLIQVSGKEIILHVLDSLYRYHDYLNIHIIINQNTNSDKLKNLVKQKYSTVKFVDIEVETGGAAETVKLGLESIGHLQNKQILILDGDSFYTTDIVTKFQKSINNSVGYFNDSGDLAQYSYIKIGSNNFVSDIKEKEKISNNANTGAYFFSDYKEFIEYADKIISDNIMFKGEYYISTVIHQMISEGISFTGTYIDKDSNISLGTPKLINNFLDEHYTFLFDLDGTLVISDNIYIDAWKIILKDYNLDINDDFFRFHIQGTSDSDCVKKLVPKCQDIKDISQMKDSYFCDHVDEIVEIEGAIRFIKFLKSKGHNVCIVTNCNRRSAEKVIESLEIRKYIDHLVAAEDCDNNKPHPDPYLQAMMLTSSQSNRCFIFEDSKSGILSAINAKPLKIIQISSTESRWNLKVDIVISDYTDENLYNQVMEEFTIAAEELDLSCCIVNSLKNRYDIIDVQIDETALKGGYICDVINVNLILSDNTVKRCILKKTNINEGPLSIMADKLQLYQREYYFYETISDYVNVNIPKFYGVIRDNNLNLVGILMEDINTEEYILNLNLNNKSIDVVLGLVNEISGFHNYFMMKDLSNFTHLESNNGPVNKPFWNDFINENMNDFLARWDYVLNDFHIDTFRLIASKYSKIEEKLSEGSLTLCHGDFKSANIFYKIDNDNDGYIPYLIDWQYIIKGKGVQDVVFLMIESFNESRVNEIFDIVTSYYYEKIRSVSNISRCEYEKDITYSICYFPVLVAVWFGTIDINELNDKNFPFFFIKRFLNFLENHVNIDHLTSL